MNRRFFRRIVIALVAAQVLSSAPLAAALAVSANGSSGAHCADIRPASDDSGDCACCPEKGMSTAACLSACLAVAAPIPAFHSPRRNATSTLVDSRPPHFRPALSEPPLKPPPIA